MSEWVLYVRVIYLKFLYDFAKIKTLNIVSDSLMTLYIQHQIYDAVPGKILN